MYSRNRTKLTVGHIARNFHDVLDAIVFRKAEQNMSVNDKAVLRNVWEKTISSKDLQQ